jgi:hypothetical protein
MIKAIINRTLGAVLIATSMISSPALANDYREKGKTVSVAKSEMSVTPSQDWNKLDARPGKKAETWTLDGEQLNDVTFYGGIAPGEPLVRERSKKHEPLPKFERDTLLVEVPEMLESTYRVYKKIGIFELTSAEPGRFLERDGVHFAYQYVDTDGLTRKGEARAVIIDDQLYMVTFDAPRLHYFARTLDAFRALADTATL